MDLPPGTLPHNAYPFGLHDKIGGPWDYAVTKGVMVIRARTCHKHVPREETRCHPCTLLSTNTNLNGVFQQMEEGVHENTHLAYHSVGGLVSIIRRKTAEVKALRLRKLNDARKLAGKAVALDHLKQWILAVGSGKVEQVDRLVRVNIARKGGIRNLLDLYDHAAQKVYHPWNYNENDELLGLLLWRLSGARVAGIAHRSLGLPSLSTLRQ